MLAIAVYWLLKATIDEQFGVDGCHRDNVTIVLLYPPGEYQFIGIIKLRELVFYFGHIFNHYNSCRNYLFYR